MYKQKMLTKYKNLEFQTMNSENNEFFFVGCSWSYKTDHAGFNFSVGLYKYQLYFSIIDTRHWDDENNKWHDVDYLDDGE